MATARGARPRAGSYPFVQIPGDFVRGCVPDGAGGTSRPDGALHLGVRRGSARWLLPALLTVGWLAAGVFAVPYIGKLTQVTSNDPSTFLPSGAESTDVQQIQESFAQHRLLVTVVVFARESGLTKADSAAIEAKAAELAKTPGLDGQATPPIPATDGKAAQVILPVSGKDPFQAGEDVKRIREMLPAGLPRG